MSFSLPPATALIERMTRYWWLVLLTGVAWIAVAVIVFRFDYSSVTAIAWLFGWVAIAVGVNELRGINEIVLAFRLHELHSRVQAVG
jgi:uncharacterized membrane protein HdeD (DUF308 family)